MSDVREVSALRILKLGDGVPILEVWVEGCDRSHLFTLSQLTSTRTRSTLREWFDVDVRPPGASGLNRLLERAEPKLYDADVARHLDLERVDFNYIMARKFWGKRRVVEAMRLAGQKHRY